MQTYFNVLLELLWSGGRLDALVETTFYGESNIGLLNTVFGSFPEQIMHKYIQWNVSPINPTYMLKQLTIFGCLCLISCSDQHYLS